jgi:hypothetical protein
MIATLKQDRLQTQPSIICWTKPLRGGGMGLSGFA